MEADWDEVSSDTNSQAGGNWRPDGAPWSCPTKSLKCAAPRSFTWQDRDVVSGLYLKHWARGIDSLSNLVRFAQVNTLAFAAQPGHDFQTTTACAMAFDSSQELLWLGNNTVRLPSRNPLACDQC
jgi:hypothetical protein